MLFLQQLHVEPKKPEQQQGLVLASHGFPTGKQRFMLKISKPSRRETPYGGQGLQQELFLRNINIQQSLYPRDAPFF